MPSDLDNQATPETAPKADDAVPPQAILAELEKITSSDAFGKAERPARFLRHLVETTLRGETQLLKESVIGVDVFDRPATWDPRIDPVVRQEAARLRKRIAKYYESAATAGDVRIELPVGSYVPVFHRPLAAPEPVVDAPAEPTPVRRHIWPYASAGILCLTLGAIAWRVMPHRDAAPSIVVLPFVNLNADPAEQYFSDGLTEEVTDSLARLKDVRVIARSSALQFKGKTADVREIGKLLNVTNVLEGSVEHSGDRVRVIAHLERATDGALLWSNTYERKAADLFEIQSELAMGIAEGLKIAAGNQSNIHVPNPEAHDYALKGRYDLQQTTPESVAQAERDFQHAIDKDPAYGSAYEGLAIAKYDECVARGSSSQTEAELTAVQDLLRVALSKDPQLVSARSMLGLLAMQYNRDWARAERELKAAVQEPSSAAASTDYGFFMLFRGRFAEADRAFARMAELDPFSVQTKSNLALARQLEGRYAEARGIAQRAASENPRMLWTQESIGLNDIEEGHPELALPVFQALESRWPAARLCQGMALAKEGKREEALALIRPFEAPPNTGIAVEWLALAYAFMGDEQNTVKWLQRSADLHEIQSLSIAIDPAFAQFRKAPEFQALEKRMGL